MVGLLRRRQGPARSELWAGATVHFHEAVENWQVIFGR